MCADTSGTHRARLRFNDCLVIVNGAKGKLTAVLALMNNAVELNPSMGEVLTKEQIGSLGFLLSEMLDEVFEAVDAMDEIFRQEFGV
jgi:hypothetical protein